MSKTLNLWIGLKGLNLLKLYYHVSLCYKKNKMKKYNLLVMVALIVSVINSWVKENKDEKCIHTFYTSVWLSSISLMSDFKFSPVNTEEDMENNSQSKKKIQLQRKRDKYFLLVLIWTAAINSLIEPSLYNRHHGLNHLWPGKCIHMLVKWLCGMWEMSVKNVLR